MGRSRTWRRRALSARSKRSSAPGATSFASASSGNMAAARATGSRKNILRAFPAGYQETNRPSRALEDIRGLETLGAEVTTEIDIHREDPADGDKVRATLLQVDRPVTLSARVPIFENMGFDVDLGADVRAYPQDSTAERGLVYLHDTGLRLSNGGKAELFARRENLEKGFLAIWSGAAANDRYNGLILSAGLDWRQAALLRAYGAYYRQTGTPHGTFYVSEVLNKHASVAASLFELFDRQVQSSGRAGRGCGARPTCAKIAGRIAGVARQDPGARRGPHSAQPASRSSTRRSGPTSTSSDGGEPGLETIAFKLKSREIDWLPAPKPFAEIFVHSPRFEGIHLRGGPIARGGLRWSDRPQDFRTRDFEPRQGAAGEERRHRAARREGRFRAAQACSDAIREASQAEGIACYKAFVSSLLSLTDNLVKATESCRPNDTIRRDGDDPYLVVAADKGTATFSDIANEIALGRDFWLGDAFASGGSAGYDHKKHGHHRARRLGSGEAPFPRDERRHPDDALHRGGRRRHVGRRVRQRHAACRRRSSSSPPSTIATSSSTPIRTRPQASQSGSGCSTCRVRAGRTTTAPRSPRAAASISRSEKDHRASGRGAEAAWRWPRRPRPTEVMAAILKAPVDLLWFGGIGTYVRGSGETDAAGERQGQRRHPRRREGTAGESDRRRRQPRRDAARAHRVRAAGRHGSTPTPSTTRRA